jgi:hypothetical protein
VDIPEAKAALVRDLGGEYDDEQLARLSRGIDQVARLWRSEDGDASDLLDFVRSSFAADSAARDALFERMEFVLESLEGHLVDVNRDFRMHADVDAGPVRAYDEVLAGYDPTAHVNDDFFANKIAFTVLLNFPLTTLEERLAEGEAWSRRQWAEARLAQRFSQRVPAHVHLAIGQAQARADQYIADYNIWVHHLVDSAGTRLFPAGLRLISHWNLREELKAGYSDPEHGLAKQRMIQKVMERIVDQSIPEVVIDNPRVDWNPFTNDVRPSATVDFDEHAIPPSNVVGDAREPDTRYELLLDVFRAVSAIDEFCPTAPTVISRRFDVDRELPEQRVTAMFTDVLTSPLVARVADLVERRLGRPLEPFDLWYSGFSTDGSVSPSAVDEITRDRYPTAAAFEADIPRLLTELGFSQERAAYVASHLEVHPARGSGHAFGAGRRGSKAYLRTRVQPTGMDYKGYNVAVHELGHNVEQTFSLYDIDHYLLAGVPNDACTEALAFVFQARDLELLGLVERSATRPPEDALHQFWMAFEMSGVALVEMTVWHWLYDHPDARSDQLREAVVAIARDVWNRYFAAVLGEPDAVLLGIYSHMIVETLYLPDYPIGHMIAFQVGQHLETADAMGQEFERISRIGRLTPDLWMKQATGAPVGPDALLEAAERALESL